MVKTDDEIEVIHDSIKFIDSQIQVEKRYNAPMVALKLGHMEKAFRIQIQRLHAIFEMAQDQRLSIQALDEDQLDSLFLELQDFAKARNLLLLTEKPLDLYQVQTTYLAEGKNLVLMVHVPTVPREHLINLYRMHPLPLPISANHALIPDVKKDIIGLTSGKAGSAKSIELSTVDLMNCKNLNHIYLCQRQGVLRKSMETTCLGSLYNQNYQQAARVCPLVTTHLEEIIYQLQDNWFLIYSMAAQTTHVHCPNGTAHDLHLLPGISKHHLTPGCQADFNSNTLQSDNSITLPGQTVHFAWDALLELQDLAKFDNLTQHLKKMHDFGFKHPTLEEMHSFKEMDNGIFTDMWHTVTIVVVISVIVLFVATLLICCCCRQKVSNALVHHILLVQDQPQFDSINRAMNKF